MSESDGGTQPIDLMGYYLTASLGVGQRLSPETISQRLARFRLDQVLRCLADIAARADRLPLGQPKAAAELARWAFPDRVLDRAEDLLAQPGAHPISSQVVVNLALMALTSCGLEEQAREDRWLREELGLLVLALGDHLAQKRDDESFAVEITRLGLFHSLHDLTNWLDLAGELFMEVIPALASDRDYVDPNEVLQAAYGLDLERFWALTVAQGVSARESDSFVSLPARVEGWSVSDDELAAWTGAWSQPVDDARLAAQRDLQRATGWSFEAFADAPLITFGPGKGCVAVRPAWLAAKATPAGMFWAIRHPFVGSGGEHERWSRFYGRAVEELGRRLIARHLPTTDVITEDDIATWGPGPNCDVMLLGDGVVAIDFVARQFTKQSAGTGDFGDLAQDLRKAAVDKLVQIDGSLHKGVAGAYLDASAPLFPLVVVGGPFPVNPLLYETVERLVHDERPRVIGIDRRCRPIAMMDLACFLVLLQTAEALECAVHALLDGWLSSGLAQLSFREWLTTDGPGRQERPGGADWGRRAFTMLGLHLPPLGGP